MRQQKKSVEKLLSLPQQQQLSVTTNVLHICLILAKSGNIWKMQQSPRCMLSSAKLYYGRPTRGRMTQGTVLCIVTDQ